MLVLIEQQEERCALLSQIAAALLAEKKQKLASVHLRALGDGATAVRKIRDAAKSLGEAAATLDRVLGPREARVR